MSSTASNHRTRERLEQVGVALIVALLLAVAAYGVAVARHYRDARAEWGRVAVTRLTDRTQECLDDLDAEVFLTYYVTAREEMPSHLKRLERSVTDFLEALKRASDGRVDYQVVDPQSDNPDSKDLEAYAARRRVSPFPVRSVRRDSYTEQTIYSSLTIEVAPHEPAQINGLTLDHLPRLQSLFVEQLEQMQNPRRGTIAIAPREGYTQLHASLSELANVVRVDLDGAEEIPARALEADALVWIDARSVEPALLRELDEFVQGGRSLVFAGSVHEPVFEQAEGQPGLRYAPSGYPAAELLSEFGLRPIDAFVGDKFHEPYVYDAVPEAPLLAAPHQVRCIAPNQDFHNLKNQPNGNLLFYAPTPFEQDDERLAERAATAQVLATTSDETWTHPAPLEAVTLASTMQEHGDLAPKLPLITLVRPNDPWQGLVIALASATPFRDGFFERPEGGVAHWRLARTLTDNLLSRERLVLTQVSSHRPEPLPALSAASRLGWRFACIVLVPLLLFGLAGLLDLATDMGLDQNTEDFGQTLAVWGVPAGPYVYVPFFGPFTLRDAIMIPVNQLADPSLYMKERSTRDKIYGVRALDIRQRLFAAEALIKDSPDRYVSIRESYLQRREYLIFDGNPPVDDDFYDDFLDEDEFSESSETQ